MIDRTGEKVLVKNHFWEIKPVGFISVDYDMRQYENKILTLRKPYGTSERWYHVEENGLVWDENWFKTTESNLNINAEDVMSVFNND